MGDAEDSGHLPDFPGGETALPSVAVVFSDSAYGRGVWPPISSPSPLGSILCAGVGRQRPHHRDRPESAVGLLPAPPARSRRLRRPDDTRLLAHSEMTIRNRECKVQVHPSRASARIAAPSARAPALSLPSVSSPTVVIERVSTRNRVNPGNGTSTERRAPTPQPAMTDQEQEAIRKPARMSRGGHESSTDSRNESKIRQRSRGSPRSCAPRRLRPPSESTSHERKPAA